MSLLEITSKLTGKVQIITEEVWSDMKRKGRAAKYRVRMMPKINLKKPVIIPEKKVVSKKDKHD